MQLNTVILSGNLTRDAELKYTPSGAAFSSFSIAHNRKYTHNDEKKEEVSFISCDFWGKSAEKLNQYLTKGKLIVVEGRLKQETWEKEGQKRERVKVVVSLIHFGPGKKKEEEPTKEPGTDQEAPKPEQPSLSEEMAWEE